MASTRQAPVLCTLRAAVTRAWSALSVSPAPAYAEPVADPRQAWLRRLDRIRAALEQGRIDLEHDGWIGGAWFGIADQQGGVRPVSTTEAFALLSPGASVNGACLVGTLLRRSADPDRATSVADVWGCVDELVEAVHEQAGHHAFPPGRCYAPAQRRARLQILTAWNDAPGRTQSEVLGLVDRAIGRTIVGACRVP